MKKSFGPNMGKHINILKPWQSLSYTYIYYICASVVFNSQYLATMKVL